MFTSIYLLQELLVIWNVNWWYFCSCYSVIYMSWLLQMVENEVYCVGSKVWLDKEMGPGCTHDAHTVAAQGINWQLYPRQCDVLTSRITTILLCAFYKMILCSLLLGPFMTPPEGDGSIMFQVILLFVCASAHLCIPTSTGESPIFDFYTLQ